MKLQLQEWGFALYSSWKDGIIYEKAAGNVMHRIE